jgi:phosphohistidine phosphatase
VILYFLRHGDAGEPRPENDDARELSPKGEAALRAAAPIWRTLKVHPDIVLSSPLPRALRSAELLIEGLGLNLHPTVDDRLKPGARWADLEDALGAHPKAERLALVGHDPDLSRAVELLTMGNLVGLRKGGLACVEFKGTAEAGVGELAWLVDPDLYGPEPDDGH